jgi:hypothetical protein
MASKEAVAMMLSEETQKHWRAVAGSNGECCGWANAAVVMADELMAARKAIRDYIGHTICDWEHRKDYFGDGDPTKLDKGERELFLAADPMLGSTASDDRSKDG